VNHIVGVADMKVSCDPADTIVTHALGSCLGIAVHDPVAKVGGLLHVMLPLSTTDKQKAEKNPLMFVDTGVPELFRQTYAKGAVKGRIVVKVAGGANIGRAENDRFQIGKRNHVILKKILWRNGVIIDGEDTGGDSARTMRLNIGTGCVELSVNGNTNKL